METPSFSVNGRAASVSISSSCLHWSFGPSDGLHGVSRLFDWRSTEQPSQNSIPLSDIIGVSLCTPGRVLHHSATLLSSSPRSPSSSCLPALLPGFQTHSSSNVPTAQVLTIWRPDSSRPFEWHPGTLLVSCEDAKELGAWCNTLQQGMEV